MTEIYDDMSKVFEPVTVLTSEDSVSDEAIDQLGTFYGYEINVKIVHGDLVDGTETEQNIIPRMVDHAGLKREWPRLRGMIKGTYSKLSTEHLCKRIILVHQDVLPNCAILASIVLCMQLSSVECERSFSTQNRLKNKFRASLQTEKLDILLTISMLGPPLRNYDPTSSIKQWLRKKRRKQRLCAEYKPREKKPRLC